jgi:hypothetical protein
MSCKDEDNGVDIKPPIEPPDPPEPTYSLVGEWWGVGSNDTTGMVVKFTEEYFSDSIYRNYSLVDPKWEDYWYRIWDKVCYICPAVDSIEMLNYPLVFGTQWECSIKTRLIWHSQDSLTIQHFRPNPIGPIVQECRDLFLTIPLVRKKGGE